MNRQALGALGENMAVDYLKKHGYKILARNCVFSGCELDIVALLSVKTQKKCIKQDWKNGDVHSKTALKAMLSGLSDMIVFVEVKYSSARAYSEPFDRVDAFKQKQIYKASQGFLYKNQINLPYRYDVVSIVGKEIQHIENAF